ncbi:MAG: MBL fold metallo-hydrolase [Clostridiales bacterium]|nr:MBL fold metallo-hydrolase [Clostridiales bacterium]
MKSVVITWLGHSCFKIEKEGYSVVIDPYTGVQGYDEFETTANEILYSHGHGDHNYAAAVRILDGGSKSPFTVTKIATFHDDERGSKRGDNLIHILETADGLRVAHFGDLGHVPDADALGKLAGCDAVLAPVGGFYTIDAKTAKDIIDAVKPIVVIPMHYRRGELGFPVLAELSDFLKLCENVIEHPGNSIEITAGMTPQTAVLQYKRV